MEVGWNGVVGIMTRLQAGDPGIVFDFLYGLFFTAPKPVLGPNWPPIQWVLRAPSPGVKLPPTSSAEIKSKWNYIPATIICLHGVHRDNFALFPHGCEWWASRPEFFIPGKTAPCAPTVWVGGWVCPGAGQDALEKGKNILHLPGIEHYSSVVHFVICSIWRAFYRGSPILKMQETNCPTTFTQSLVGFQNILQFFLLPCCDKCTYDYLITVVNL
jgi:hypothetical protein